MRYFLFFLFGLKQQLVVIYMCGLGFLTSLQNRHPRFFWFLCAVLTSIVLVVWVDQSIALYVHHATSREVKDFFKLITDWAKGAIWFQVCAVWFVVALIGIIKSGSQRTFAEWRYQMRCALFFLCALLASGLALITSKFIIGRYRPRYLFRDDTYGFLPFNTDFSALSYPSGHTQVAFCVATVISILWPKMLFPAYIFAFVLGVSRVMVSAHYPADIVMGAFVGVFVTLLVRDRFERDGKKLLWRSPVQVPARFLQNLSSRVRWFGGKRHK